MADQQESPQDNGAAVGGGVPNPPPARRGRGRVRGGQGVGRGKMAGEKRMAREAKRVRSSQKQKTVEADQLPAVEDPPSQPRANSISQDTDSRQLRPRLTLSSSPSPGFSKPKSTPQTKPASCTLTQVESIWMTALFLCKWESDPDICYNLKQLIKNGNGTDSSILCKWLIKRLSHGGGFEVRIGIDDLVEDNKYRKGMACVDGTVYYLLDHVEYNPISETITPITSSVVSFPDVGMVYNRTMVLRIEIQSSPMRNAVAKLAANLIDDCRYLRHFDQAITKVEGFAFCNSKDEGYVCKVTIEWKDLTFHVSAKAMECDENTILSSIRDAFNSHVEYAHKVIDKVKQQKTLDSYFIPFSDKDVEVLKGLISQSKGLISQSESERYRQINFLKQVGSWYSLVFTDNHYYYYKYCPDQSSREKMSSLMTKERCDLLVFPIDILYVPLPSKKELPLVVFDKQEQQLSDLTHEEQKSCLYFIADGINNALTVLHEKYEIAHLDVRLDNVCFHNDTVTLIDFDRSQSVAESSVQGYGNSFMYTFPEQHEESERSIKLLDWKQLGILIFSIMHGKTQTDLQAKDFKSETGGTLVASLVHKGVWNAGLAEKLSKEKTIQECFERRKQS